MIIITAAQTDLVTRPFGPQLLLIWEKIPMNFVNKNTGAFGSVQQKNQNRIAARHSWYFGTYMAYLIVGPKRLSKVFLTG